ncbi:MAG: type II secretion system F family protein [Fimbriimonadaceae bacterium]|nr:type II secretion system F family protein [Fimbriimonadaceae bacterium]
MTTFSYTALEPSGRKKIGFVDAASREAAIATVAADGRFVLEIKEAATKRESRGLGQSKSVGKGDLALFTRRMADLAAAGLPLDRVLQVVAEQSESAYLTEVAEDALDQVRKGSPVSEALAKHPKLFPAIFTQTLRAGEASGQFAEVAARLADFQEKEVTRRSQIISAMIYPGVLTFTAVSVVIFLITFVMPRLSPVFKGLGTELPVTTKMLLGTTDFITANWMLIIGVIVGGIFLFRTWVKTEAGALAKDRMIFRMPVAGSVIRKATVSRFSRVLGTLVYGGVPILEAIRIAGLSSGNRVFMRSSQQVEQEVREGRPIADAMRDAGDFPPVLTHMVAIGEETGDLPKMLGRVSESLDFEVDNGMRRLTAMVEPVIVLVMGTFVGFVVLSVLLPIFEAQAAVK